MQVPFLLLVLRIFIDAEVVCQPITSVPSGNYSESEVGTKYDFEESNITDSPAAKENTEDVLNLNSMFTEGLKNESGYLLLDDLQDASLRTTTTMPNDSVNETGSVFQNSNNDKDASTDFTGTTKLSPEDETEHQADLKYEKQTTGFKIVTSFTNSLNTTTDSYFDTETTTLIFGVSSNYGKNENSTVLILSGNESSEFETEKHQTLEFESTTRTNLNSDEDYESVSESLEFVSNWNSNNTSNESLATSNEPNITYIVETQKPSKNCANITVKNITNTFQAYLKNAEINSNRSSLFESYLRRYFPNDACKLAVISVSGNVVTWTNMNLNRSAICSDLRKHFLRRIVNNEVVDSEFHNFFLPDFDVQFVNWSSTVRCASRSFATPVNTLDTTIYVLGSLLLLGVVTMVIVFLRGKTCKSHDMDVNATPNTYQKYTLRGRQPAFLSPELHRPTTMATCNPAYIDDETIEPKAKCYMETC